MVEARTSYTFTYTQWSSAKRTHNRSKIYVLQFYENKNKNRDGSGRKNAAICLCVCVCVACTWTEIGSWIQHNRFTIDFGPLFCYAAFIRIQRNRRGIKFKEKRINFATKVWPVTCIHVYYSVVPSFHVQHGTRHWRNWITQFRQNIFFRFFILISFLFFVRIWRCWMLLERSVCCSRQTLAI